MKTSGQFSAFSVCHFVGPLLFWPLGVRARSVGRREQVSGDDTQYLYSILCTPEATPRRYGIATSYTIGITFFYVVYNYD